MKRERLFCVLFVSGFFILFSGCEKAGDILKEAVQPPKVSLSDISVRGISSKKLDLSARLAIDNPNPVGIRLASLEYAFELADSQLFSGTSDEGLDIMASGQSFAEIPISLGYEEVKGVYDSARGQDEVPYRIKGKAGVNTPIGSIPIPFDVKGTLPVIRPPSIRSVDLDVDSLSFSSAELALKIGLMNPNNFDLNISKLGYTLILDGKDFSQGKVESARVSARSEGTISVPISLNLLSLGSWAYSLLRGGSADYELSYDADYIIRDWPVKQEETKTGTLRIR
jgi:LEA14-like dessication related protein